MLRAVQEPGTSNTVVGLDNFQYTAYVPLPVLSSLQLVVMGLLGFGVALCRRRVRRPLQSASAPCLLVQTCYNTCCK